MAPVTSDGKSMSSPSLPFVFTAVLLLAILALGVFAALIGWFQVRNPEGIAAAREAMLHFKGVVAFDEKAGCLRKGSRCNTCDAVVFGTNPRVLRTHRCQRSRNTASFMGLFGPAACFTAA